MSERQLRPRTPQELMKDAIGWIAFIALIVGAPLLFTAWQTGFFE